MLVLSRKVEEEIVIGDIVFKVLKIDNTCVRVGIAAPDDVKIYRREVLDEIEKLEKEVGDGKV